MVQANDERRKAKSEEDEFGINDEALEGILESTEDEESDETANEDEKDDRWE